MIKNVWMSADRRLRCRLGTLAVFGLMLLMYLTALLLPLYFAGVKCGYGNLQNMLDIPPLYIGAAVIVIASPVLLARSFITIIANLLIAGVSGLMSIGLAYDTVSNSLECFPRNGSYEQELMETISAAGFLFLLLLLGIVMISYTVLVADLTVWLAVNLFRLFKRYHYLFT